MIREIYKPYWILAIIRFALIFVPQTGYIHPDEFFQSLEVLIGEFFEVEVNKPWEFTTTTPIRSITLCYFIVGFAYKILKFCNFIAWTCFSTTIITPYTLILFPRLVICLLSFLVDYSLYRICINNNEKYKARLLILASSYVIVVFGTRTFTNTLELILFSLLLYYIADSMTFSNIILRQQEYLNKRYKKSKTKVEKAKFHKLILYLQSHSLRNTIQISTLTVVGFFNRPTFLAFAVCPIFFWLYRGLGFKSVISLHFHLRMLLLLLSAIPTLLFFVLVDSLFYRYLTLSEIEFLTVTINNFVFTPWNFLRYNINSNNLANHGLHPRYLHLLINIPLLFNILGICAFYDLSILFRRLVNKQLYLLPSVRSIKGLMVCSLIVPITVLSFFPHQEPRFLIPLLIPVVYLSGQTLLTEPNTELVQVTKESLEEEQTPKVLKEQTHYILKAWMILNLLMLLFYGFIHQGGVIPAVSHLAEKMNAKPTSVRFHIYTTHTYSLPESLFFQRSSDKLLSSKEFKFKNPKRVYLHEEGSKDLSLVFKKISTSLVSSKWLENKYTNATYLIFPNSLRGDLDYLVFHAEVHLILERCVTFYPHFSAEAPPSPSVFMDWLLNNSYRTVRILDIIDSLEYFFKGFGLSVCQIKRYGV